MGVCVGVYPVLGQLCTINKVIHLPQKLFENLQPRRSSTDADADLTPVRTAPSSPASTPTLQLDSLVDLPLRLRLIQLFALQ